MARDKWPAIRRMQIATALINAQEGRSLDGGVNSAQHSLEALLACASGRSDAAAHRKVPAGAHVK